MQAELSTLGIYRVIFVKEKWKICFSRLLCFSVVLQFDLDLCWSCLFLCDFVFSVGSFSSISGLSFRTGSYFMHAC